MDSWPRGGRLRSETLNKNLRSHVLLQLQDRFPHSRFQSITAHCLRHFFRTHATYCGISTTEIDAWMGHGGNTMSQHYFHADIESACESIKKFKPLLLNAETSLNSEGQARCQTATVHRIRHCQGHESRCRRRCPAPFASRVHIGIRYQSRMTRSRNMSIYDSLSDKLPLL